MQIKNVQIGQVKLSDHALETHGIGSCIAVAAYDEKRKLGVLAHVMLPGRAPKKKKVGRTKYAENAVNKMLFLLAQKGSEKTDLRLFLVGGANVLRKRDDTVCQLNIDSVTSFLEKKELFICKKKVGGTKGKSVFFNVKNGMILYNSIGGKYRTLWNKEHLQKSQL